MDPVDPVEHQAEPRVHERGVDHQRRRTTTLDALPHLVHLAGRGEGPGVGLERDHVVEELHRGRHARVRGRVEQRACAGGVPPGDAVLHPEAGAPGPQQVGVRESRGRAPPVLAGDREGAVEVGADTAVVGGRQPGSGPAAPTCRREPPDGRGPPRGRLPCPARTSRRSGHRQRAARRPAPPPHRPARPGTSPVARRPSSRAPPGGSGAGPGVGRPRARPRRDRSRSGTRHRTATAPARARRERR